MKVPKETNAVVARQGERRTERPLMETQKIEKATAPKPSNDEKIAEGR